MNTGALQSLDWAIIAGYLVFVVWLGARFARRQTSSGHYFLGGGRLPGWAVGLSLFATIISSWAFLALPGKAFRSDLQYLLAVAGLPLVACLAARWVIPMFRKRIRLSAYEYLENRFGLVARVYGNLAFVVVHFGEPGCSAHQRMKVALWLMGKISSPVFRRPTRSLSQAQIDRIRDDLHAIGCETVR